MKRPTPRLINAHKCKFDMTHSNLIFKYSLRVAFNYRGKTQMAKSDEINHVGSTCQVVMADRRTAPLVGYT